MKKICVVALIFSIFMSFTACGSPTPSSVETNKEIVNETEVDTNESIEDKVAYDVIDSTNICIMRFTNNSDIPVEIEVNFVFNNANKKEDAGYGHLYCLGVGESGIISMKKPTDENQIPIEGVTTEYTVSVSEEGLFDSDASFKKDITFDDSKSDDGITVTVHNNSDKDVENVTVGIVYYNGDVPVWYDDYGYDISAGSEYNWTFDNPHFYDSNNTTISFDRYEIVLNDAFNYTN